MIQFKAYRTIFHDKNQTIKQSKAKQSKANESDPLQREERFNSAPLNDD